MPSFSARGTRALCGRLSQAKMLDFTKIKIKKLWATKEWRESCFWKKSLEFLRKSETSPVVVV